MRAIGLIQITKLKTVPETLTAVEQILYEEGKLDDSVLTVTDKSVYLETDSLLHEEDISLEDHLKQIVYDKHSYFGFNQNTLKVERLKKPEIISTEFAFLYADVTEPSYFAIWDSIEEMFQFNNGSKGVVDVFNDIHERTERL